MEDNQLHETNLVDVVVADDETRVVVSNLADVQVAVLHFLKTGQWNVLVGLFFGSEIFIWGCKKRFLLRRYLYIMNVRLNTSKMRMIFPLRSSSRAIFSRIEVERTVFRNHMFLIRRTDIPNLYAANRAAFGTTFKTSVFYVGTY
ncbi:hypothetical protein CTI12_AA502720 [Artemisia annua]|uniref:Uncharacterized protein n=1 Tax=Artemisia annua TaxID=35608 RepID=A0A2U1LDS3_ARTAN|nr:hypothetical protein CTI12_AA502720 [Artemisia annua]